MYVLAYGCFLHVLSYLHIIFSVLVDNYYLSDIFKLNKVNSKREKYNGRREN